MTIKQSIKSKESTLQIYFPLALKKPVGYAKVWAPEHEGDIGVLNKLDLRWFSVSRVEEAIGAIFPELKFPKTIAWEPTHHPGSKTPREEWRGSSANLATFLAVGHTAYPFRLKVQYLWASGAIEVDSSAIVRAQGELNLKLEVFHSFCQKHECGHDAVMFLPLGGKTQLAEKLEELNFEVLQWPTAEDIHRAEQRLFSTEYVECNLRPLIIFFPPNHLKELVDWFHHTNTSPKSTEVSKPSPEPSNLKTKVVKKWLLVCFTIFFLIGLMSIASHNFCIGLFKPTIGNTSLSRKGRCHRRLWVVEFCENLCILKCPRMKDKTCVHRCYQQSNHEYNNIMKDSKGNLCKKDQTSE